MAGPVNDPYAEYLTARGNSSDRTAVMYYTRALERDPDFDLAYVYRGEIYANGLGNVPRDAKLSARWFSVAETLGEKVSRAKGSA